jgi:thiamine biosynthesis lipoprotein
MDTWARYIRHKHRAARPPAGTRAWRKLISPRASRVSRALTGPEAIETFACFGGTVSVIVSGTGPAGGQVQAAARARQRLLEWHHQFSRFEPQSELSRLNADPRETLGVSPVLARLIEATVEAARMSGGLVDSTLVGELERIGYAEHFASPPLGLHDALRLAPPRAPARPSPRARWQEVSLDRGGGTVTRPAGLCFDSGGLAKGLFGDILAGVLAMHESFAIDCGGDVRLGGAGRLTRGVQVASPFDESILHTFALSAGAVATSGIGNRSWLDAEGRPAHHLLDPATSRPAFTGIVQVSAIAATAVEAETLAKMTLLRGPGQSSATLRHGGLVVYDDQSFEVIRTAHA